MMRQFRTIFLTFIFLVNPIFGGKKWVNQTEPVRPYDLEIPAIFNAGNLYEIINASVTFIEGGELFRFKSVRRHYEKMDIITNKVELDLEMLCRGNSDKSSHLVHNQNKRYCSCKKCILNIEYIIRYSLKPLTYVHQQSPLNHMSHEENTIQTEYNSIEIELKDIDEHSIKFSEQNYRISIPENVDIETNTWDLPMAFDADPSDDIIYRLTKQTCVMNEQIKSSYYEHRELCRPFILVFNRLPEQNVFSRFPSNQYYHSTTSLLSEQYQDNIIRNGPNSYGELRQLQPKLKSKNKLDREIYHQYWLQLSASNAPRSNRTISKSTINIIIDIIDVNDNIPKFDSDEYTINVKEDMEVNSLIMTMHATDADDRQNNSISYSIEPIITKDKEILTIFSINKLNGNLFLKKELDREIRNNYRVMVRAQDVSNNETKAMVGYTIVNINVLDVNDNMPTISMSIGEIEASEKYISSNVFNLEGKRKKELERLHHFRENHLQFNQFMVEHEKKIHKNIVDLYHQVVVLETYENIKSSITLFQMEVYDTDENENSSLDITLDDVTEANLKNDKSSITFYINSDSANLHQIRAVSTGIKPTIFDYEKLPVHLLVVAVEDNGVSMQNSVLTLIVILVMNENDNSPKLKNRMEKKKYEKLLGKFNLNGIVSTEIDESNKESCSHKSFLHPIIQFKATDLDQTTNTHINYRLFPLYWESGYNTKVNLEQYAYQKWLRKHLFLNPVTGDLHCLQSFDLEDEQYSLLFDTPNIANKTSLLFRLIIDDNSTITDKNRKYITRIGVAMKKQNILDTSQQFKLIFPNEYSSMTNTKTEEYLFVLHLKDHNEFPPVFHHQPYIFSIDSLSPIGLYIGTIKVTDFDMTTNLRYWIIREDKFQLKMKRNNQQKIWNEIGYFFSVNERDGRLFIRHNLVKFANINTTSTMIRIGVSDGKFNVTTDVKLILVEKYQNSIRIPPEKKKNSENKKTKRIEILSKLQTIIDERTKQSFFLLQHNQLKNRERIAEFRMKNERIFCRLANDYWKRIEIFHIMNKYHLTSKKNRSLTSSCQLEIIPERFLYYENEIAIEIDIFYENQSFIETKTIYLFANGTKMKPLIPRNSIEYLHDGTNVFYKTVSHIPDWYNNRKYVIIFTTVGAVILVGSIIVTAQLKRIINNRQKEKKKRIKKKNAFPDKQTLLISSSINSNPQHHRRSETINSFNHQTSSINRQILNGRIISSPQSRQDLYSSNSNLINNTSLQRHHQHRLIENSQSFSSATSPLHERSSFIFPMNSNYHLNGKYQHSHDCSKNDDEKKFSIENQYSKNNEEHHLLLSRNFDTPTNIRYYDKNNDQIKSMKVDTDRHFDQMSVSIENSMLDYSTSPTDSYGEKTQFNDFDKRDLFHENRLDDFKNDRNYLKSKPLHQINYYMMNNNNNNNKKKNNGFNANKTIVNVTNMKKMNDQLIPSSASTYYCSDENGSNQTNITASQFSSNSNQNSNQNSYETKLPKQNICSINIQPEESNEEFFVSKHLLEQENDVLPYTLIGDKQNEKKLYSKSKSNIVPKLYNGEFSPNDILLNNHTVNTNFDLKEPSPSIETNNWRDVQETKNRIDNFPKFSINNPRDLSNSSSGNTLNLTDVSKPSSFSTLSTSQNSGSTHDKTSEEYCLMETRRQLQMNKEIELNNSSPYNLQSNGNDSIQSTVIN
ncbi:hypothetical protein SNEBB_008075 [Seison nebaliae]|nr:hypothetical protein SNEBB_008075 [Seison nebaliae]